MNNKKNLMNIKQYYKSIVKYPVSTGLNILSLVIAFSGIITILLYVTYENSFDKYNKNYDTIYKIQVGKNGNTVPAVLTPILRKNVPYIDAITPIWVSSSKISKPNSVNKDGFYSISTIYANSDIFNIFTYNFIYGSPENALANDKTIVLTKSSSFKLFGNENPVGKKVNVDDSSYICTGVIDDLPKTSSIHTDVFISFQTIIESRASSDYSWSEWSYRIFAKINDNKNFKDVITKINSIDEIKKQLNIDDNKKDYFYLMPLKDLHYTQTWVFYSVNKTVLNVLLLLALILALMGTINFINLLTSQAIQRSKVFSIKRILGASRMQLIMKLIIESIFIALVSLAIALVLHSIIYPKFQDILQIEGMSFEGRKYWIGYFVIFTIIYAIFSSIYPAIYITSANVTQSIKGNYSFSGTGKRIKNILLVLQFTFTIILIIGSIAINKQIKYWHNFDTGIQTENIIYLNNTSNIKKHKEAFVKELMSYNNIIDYTFTWFVPGSVGMNWGRTIEGQGVSFVCWPIDERFLNFFDIKITEGRKFSKNIEADRNKFIINESTVKEYNWDKPLEKIIPGFGFNGAVIGVSKDFNFASLKDNIQPMIFWLTNERSNVSILKISKGNTQETINYIEKIWNKYEHEMTFNYHFLDEHLQQQYGKEENIAYFIEAVTLWCILLSLTGLLGLALFVAKQRTKEIGIRKANGASVREILKMLNKVFLNWIVIAFIIAVPVAYFAVNKWLENFAYRTDISWWVFALAGLIVLIISIAAVSLQSLKVARKNPVESLKYE